MLQVMSVNDVLRPVKEHIADKTGIPCYDDPEGKASPFYSVQLLKTENSDTKTSFVNRFDVWIHCISEPTNPYSPALVHDMVSTLEEAMTEEPAIPAPCRFARIVDKGIQTVKKDESGEGHAVLSFEFFVCYGFKCK